MQEAGLKRREERRFKKEREGEEQTKGKKQEAVFSVEKPEAREIEKIAKKQIIFKMPFLQPKVFREIKLHKCEFNKEIPKIIISKPPILQPKEIKEIKAKIKTFSTEITEKEGIKQNNPKIRVKTKPFRGVSRKSLVFNIMIPTIKKKSINLAVPNLTTKHFYGLKARNIHFNSELPEISVPPKTMFVPRIGVKTFSGVKAKEKNLISDIPQVLSGGIPLAEVIKRERGKEIAKIQEQIAAEVSGEEAEKELELPNFFELLLGKGAERISEGKPICIIVEETKEKYEELIAVLCRDIYREKIGGKPTPIYRETIKELRHEFEPRVGGEIVVVENVEKNLKDSSKYLSQILKGFFSIPNMGFLILVSNQPLKLADDIRKEVQPEGIIVINPPAEIESIKDEFLKVVKGKNLPAPVRSFGEEFKRSVDVFDDELIKRYLDDKKAPWELKQDRDRLIASSSNGEKKASPIHSAMKAFVWMYEWNKHEKRIIPELEKEEDNRIVDVKIEDRNYEIETLFSVGDVEGELVKKIKNYSKGERVYFVLRNMDIIRNLSLFLSFRRDWRKAGYKVEFFGLDLDKEELVPLEEFVKIVKSQKAKEG